MPLILEGLVTTRNVDGSTNLAPMGPIVQAEEQGAVRRLVFRPFPESTTCQNLLRHPEGIFHATDDVLLFARAVTKSLPELADQLMQAKMVDVLRLKRACVCLEFRVTDIDPAQQRVVVQADVVHQESVRDWLGYNRAQFAVIEACITATRLHLLDKQQVSEQMCWLTPLVEKTAGPREREAFELVCHYIRNQQLTGGKNTESVDCVALNAVVNQQHSVGESG